jgi:hypothetical protein
LNFVDIAINRAMMMGFEMEDMENEKCPMENDQ